jgi:hypothetical protein
LPIVIQPYRQEHEDAVREFNRRLQSGGADRDLVFYEQAEPPWLPQRQNSSLFNEFFLALDGGVVRGGYALKHQNFSFADGSIHTIGYYHHPLSEGIVDKVHAAVGGLLLRDAMQRSPLLYCLGMGGYDRPLPKMLARLGWSHFLVPFYFRVVRTTRFMREMQALRTSRMRRFLMDFGAYSGAAWAALKAFELFKQFRAPQPADCEVEVVDDFGSWADALWEQSRHHYCMSAVRDSVGLRTLYPASDGHFTRLRLRRDGNGHDLGWAVVAEKRKDAKYGSLRVGSIVDCWAAPENTLAVVRAATAALERAGVDLIVSNQSHKNWCAAVEAAGFLKAQSNFIFAASKKLAEWLQPFNETKRCVHMTRSDGDGLPRNF